MKSLISVNNIIRSENITDIWGNESDSFFYDGMFGFPYRFSGKGKSHAYFYDENLLPWSGKTGTFQPQTKE